MTIISRSPRIFFIVLEYVINAVEDCMSDKRGNDKTNSCDDCKNS